MTPDWYRGRPMSPHLQVWRFHWTMWASITHRATGVANYVCVTLLALWIVCMAMSGGEVERVYALISGLPGIVFWLAIYGFSVSLTYHLINGVRHLVWDAGRGFDPELSSKISVAIFAVTAVVALLLVGFALLVSGALS